MSQTELLQLLRAQPFRPFRLRLSNDTTYDIRHPDLAIATPTAIIVGIPATAPPATSVGAGAQDFVIVSMFHVVQIEFLSAPPVSQPGAGSSKN